ncbi:hypothetical protein [Burkholderia ambifaria]|uniref:hypothetical protein n=1 Tax=Burkholderia ambifaria TaxID=152480 RepID=UPI000F80AD34|nr:hypothetical protein [Burkholderia ambifaria]
MISHIPVAAPPGLDLAAPARDAGWLGTITCRHGELLCGAALLHLGSQVIPVRLVLHDDGIEVLLQRLAEDLHTSLYLEEFCVLAGFSVAQVRAFRARVRHPLKRLHVGTPDEYVAWLRARLGPLRSMVGNSPVRQLLEPFLSYSHAPPVTKRTPLVGSFKGSAIESSFDQGALGIQALSTLFQQVRGRWHIINVEEDRAWQKKGADLLVSGLAGGLAGPWIAMDGKTENKDTGNLSLEHRSNLTLDKLGWLWTSTMSVLASLTWPSGEVFFIDFRAVKAWVESGQHNLKLVKGTAKGQSYFSSIYLLPIATLLAQFPESSCFLSLSEWLPLAYDNQFTGASLVPARYASRKLVPQRLV